MSNNIVSCARRGLESKLQMNGVELSKVQEVIGEEGFIFCPDPGLDFIHHEGYNTRSPKMNPPSQP